MIELGTQTAYEKAARLCITLALWLIGVACLIGILGQQEAQSAPKANSGDECALFADMTLVARALALEGVPKATAVKAVPRIYYMLPAGERIAGITAAVIDAAYRDHRDARTMAETLGRVCIQSHGDMDSLLGVRM